VARIKLLISDGMRNLNASREGWHSFNRHIPVGMAIQRKMAVPRKPEKNAVCSTMREPGVVAGAGDFGARKFRVIPHHGGPVISRITLEYLNTPVQREHFVRASACGNARTATGQFPYVSFHRDPQLESLGMESGCLRRNPGTSKLSIARGYGRIRSVPCSVRIEQTEKVCKLRLPLLPPPVSVWVIAAFSALRSRVYVARSTLPLSESGPTEWLRA